MSDSVLLEAGETWLVEQWLEKFTAVLASMVDEHPSLSWSTEGADDLGLGAMLLEFNFSASPDPLLWIGVPEEVWRDIGTRVLQAAGVETVSDEEGRNTCLEVLQQTSGGLAQALTQRLQREITIAGSREPRSFPKDSSPIRVVLKSGETPLPPVWIAFAPGLNALLEGRPVDGPSHPAEDRHPVPAEPEAPAVVSKTFDLLLDVALPVSISFGRTELAVKEVLKLTTGSIVELNRAVNEPVEVIVNNCVIARGEVVVVDGNYGVRIHQIVSRQERLKTGSAAGTALRAPRISAAMTSQVAIQ